MAEGEPDGGGYVQVPADCVNMCAESLGIAVTQDVIPALAEDVNYRVREATQNAIQFMRHAKRRKLMTDDFDKALYWSNVEPLFGFGGEPPVFNSIHESGLYSVEDKEVNLREMAFTDHLDELSSSSTNGLQLTAKWISVENHHITDEIGGQQIIIQPKCGDAHKQYLFLLMDAIQGTSDEFKRVALADIRNNPSAVDVAPDLVNIVMQIVQQRFNLTGSHVCRALRILSALLNNSLLYLGPFAPSLVEVLTHMVLEPHPSWPLAKEKITHTQLSQLSAVCIGELIRKYADSVNNLRGTLHNILAKTLSQPDPHLVKLTGAVQIISFLGGQSISDVLLNHMENLVELVHSSTESSDTSVRNTAMKLYNALLDSAIVLLANEDNTGHPSLSDYNHLCDLFGETLLMSLEAPPGYTTGNTSAKKPYSKEPAETPAMPPPSVAPQRCPIGGFSKTARRVPVTKPFGKVFFPVYKKPSPVAINILDSSVRRDRSLDISRAVAMTGKIPRTKQHPTVISEPPSLSSLTL